jgi:hypothetical protein
MNADDSGALPPSEAVMAWARVLYADSVDKKDARGFAAAFTETASLRFGNADPIVGRDAIESAIAYFFTTFETLRHEDRGTRLAGDTLIIEAVVTYKRHDGREVSIPAVTIFHLAGTTRDEPSKPLADNCRIYVDLTPLYAPA